MYKIINQLLNKKYTEYIILTVILITGFTLRLYKINSPIADWHSWRQADTASVTRIYVNEGINILVPRYYDISSIQTSIYNPKGLRFVEFPIYNFVHALLVKSFVNISLEVWGRLLSSMCSIISALVVFLLGKRFIGRNGGLTAALFFVILPYNIYYSRVILPEPMAVMFGLISIWLFTRFLDYESTKTLFLSGLFFAMSLLIKPFTIFYSIPMIYLLFKKFKLNELFDNPRLLIKLLIFTDVALIPFILWRGWVFKFPDGIPSWKWAFNGDNIRFRPAFFRWIFGERIGRLILGIWGLIPFSYGIIKVRKSNMFIQVFVIGVLAYVTVFATANVKHDYYQTYLIPALSLALASGAIYLWKAKSLKLMFSRILLISSVLLMVGISTYQIKEFYKINHPEIIEAGKYVDEVTEKDAKIIAAYGGDTALLYQTNRYGWPVIDDSVDVLIQRGADYYLSVVLTDSDTSMLKKRFKTIKETESFIVINLNEEI